MKVLLAQSKPVVGSIEKNLSTLVSVISKMDADLAIFPELFITGYMPRDEVASMAETIDGSTVSNISDLCRDTSKSVIVGLPLKHPTVSGQITNSAIIVDAKGKVTRYDKTYLPTFGSFEESLYFAEGCGATVADIGDLRVGVMICYDIFFPELSKLLAIKGADMLVCISASPTSTVENFKRIIPARAIENASYFAYVNCVGSHLDLVFGGMSRLVDPRADLIAEARPLEEDLCVGEVDSSVLEQARRMRPTLRDSRKEVFEAIINQLDFS